MPLLKASYRRPRRSFGGKDGIWWRKRSFLSSEKADVLDGTDASNVGLSDGNDLSSLAWDATLCRPVTVRLPNTSDSDTVPAELSLSDEETCSESEEDDDFRGHKMSITSQHLKKEALVETKMAAQRTGKAYGSRSRSALYLLDDEAPSFGASRKVSLSPHLNETNASNGNRVAEKRTLDSLDFVDDDAGDQKKRPVKRRRWGRPISEGPPTSLTSPRSAKAYFDKLDAEPLTMEVAIGESPRISSHTYRTSFQKPRMPASPTVLAEYDEYARTAQQMGLSPVPLIQFSSSSCFRKGKPLVFDGFLENDD